MMTPVASKPIALSFRMRHGRAVNAIAQYFRSLLSVPNIYIEPRGPRTIHLDLLAVDRAGSGDLHGAEIKLRDVPPSVAGLKSYLGESKDWPTHFRYFALPDTASTRAALPKLPLFSPDGIGRIGILLVSESRDDLPVIELAIRPERFRIAPEPLAKIERFLSRSRPDIEIRI